MNLCTANILPSSDKNEKKFSTKNKKMHNTATPQYRIPDTLIKGQTMIAVESTEKNRKIQKNKTKTIKSPKKDKRSK